MPSNHLVLCLPLLFLPSIFSSIRFFPNELALHIRWPKYWSFSFSISLSNEYSVVEHPSLFWSLGTLLYSERQRMVNTIIVWQVSQEGLVVKNPRAMQVDIRDLGLIPGLGRSPGEGKGNPFQYACLGNPMDRGAWWTTVHGVTQSWTQLKQLSIIMV